MPNLAEYSIIQWQPRAIKSEDDSPDYQLSCLVIRLD